jgi:hypothetical protein
MRHQNSTRHRWQYSFLLWKIRRLWNQQDWDLLWYPQGHLGLSLVDMRRPVFNFETRKAWPGPSYSVLFQYRESLGQMGVWATKYGDSHMTNYGGFQTKKIMRLWRRETVPGFHSKKELKQAEFDHFDALFNRWSDRHWPIPFLSEATNGQGTSVVVRVNPQYWFDYPSWYGN